MKDRGYMISNQHSVTTMGESLPEILNPLAPECEPSIVSPSENHEHTLVCDESPIEEIPSFSESEDLHSLYTNMFDDNHSHEHPPVYHVVHTLTLFLQWNIE
jgi:hypothetical protein